MKLTRVDYRPSHEPYPTVEGASFLIELPNGEKFWLRESQPGLSGHHLFITAELGRIIITPIAANAIYIDYKDR